MTEFADVRLERARPGSVARLRTSTLAAAGVAALTTACIASEPESRNWVVRDRAGVDSAPAGLGHSRWDASVGRIREPGRVHSTRPIPSWGLGWIPLGRKRAAHGHRFATWSAFDADGVWQGDTKLAAGSRVVEIEADFAIVLFRNELDVESIEVLSVQRADS